MRIVFRSDASLQLGAGHVMRCLALADALRERGAQCSFICRPQAGHLLQLIAQRGHQALALPVLQEGTGLDHSGMSRADWLGIDWVADAEETQQVLNDCMGRAPLDWLVVDHYALERRWEQALRTNARHILVIDDLADRPHDCDLLLDQNLGRTEEDYSGLITPTASTQIGPQYALLRPQFAELRPKSLARRAQSTRLQHLLITMGGVDRDNVTGLVLDALNACTLLSDLQITIVMGPHAPWLAQVQAKAAHMNWPTQVLVGVNNMAQLMAESDLAIGAAGGTAWERCCLGLPSLVLALAENQLAGAIALQNAGAAIVLKTHREITEILGQWQSERVVHEMLTKLSNAAAAVTDGKGCARAADRMMESAHA